MGQSSPHQPGHRGIDERFARLPAPLVVLAQTTTVPEPAARALHDPAASPQSLHAGLPAHDALRRPAGRQTNKANSPARPWLTTHRPRCAGRPGRPHMAHPAGVAHACRFGNGGAAHRRRSIALGVHRPQRGRTPGPEILLHVVHRLSISPRHCLAWHMAEIVPEPLGVEMMGQTGQAALWLLPRFRCYPFESR